MPGSTSCGRQAGRAGSRARRRGENAATGTATGTAPTITSPGATTARPEWPAWLSRPSRATLAWAAAAVGTGARVRSVRRLGGGIAQATDALTIDDAGGGRRRLVLQRWLRPGWELDDPGFDPAKEAAVLHAFATSPIPVPRVVAVDPDGSAAGVPALLTARLPGRPPTPALVGRRSTQVVLGGTLAEIHRFGNSARLAADADLRRLVPDYRPFGSLADATVPRVSRRPDVWRAALAIAAGPLPVAPTPVLIHRDFHAWNTLWLGDRLTGVVDWTSASWGAPAADLAHLRVDLAVDVSVEAAVAVRAAYARAGGDLADARHHQMRTVFDYLTDTDPASIPGAVERLDAFLGIVLEEPDATPSSAPDPLEDPLPRRP